MKSKSIRELTRAEEEVMQILWSLEKAFVKDMLPHFEEPTPAYNTVSTIVRILEEKGFIGHESFGKSHQYYPVISKDEYSEYVINNITTGYFSGSFRKLLSFMAEKNDLSMRDIEEIKKEIKKKKK